MSAREELFRRVAGSFVDEERANKLIDDLLHEEAEKIREHARVTGKPGSVGYAGLMSGADLINPYKE